ncbi:MAG TPA: dTDP-4-dehydrorhamnose reductase [Methanomassiliicoccales archaeon]|nr:dTDP-4-dehydrorhamnose reductase [Methanomassiliicoccales archaeon]
MNRVLVVGAAGLLGQYLMKAGKEMGLKMSGTYNSVVPTDTNEMLHMDITDRGRVAEVIEGSRPELLVLSAAMTNVDQCEREPAKAYAVNMEGAFNVAAECKKAGVKLVYISTDYVFNGLKGSHYYEFENPDPLGIYAQSKLEGERVTLDASRSNLVCRVSVVYGWNREGGKQNFVTWVIDSLQKGQGVRLYSDQYVSPTYAPDAAKVILELAVKGAHGTYHTSGPDCLSRYEIGVKVAETFSLDQGLISPVLTEEMPLMAARPPRSCLSVDQAEAELDRSMVNMSQGLTMMRSDRP